MTAVAENYDVTPVEKYKPVAETYETVTGKYERLVNAPHRYTTI